MFAKNNFLLGLVVGAVFPAAVYGIFNYWHKDWVLMNKPVIPYLVAVFVNLLLIRTFHKHNADTTVRGLMLITFIALIAIFLFKTKI